MDKKIYLIDLHQAPSSLQFSKLTQEEFISIAEEQGYVYALEEYADAYNHNNFDALIMFSIIRVY